MKNTAEFALYTEACTFLWGTPSHVTYYDEGQLLSLFLFFFKYFNCEAIWLARKTYDELRALLYNIETKL